VITEIVVRCKREFSKQWNIHQTLEGAAEGKNGSKNAAINIWVEPEATEKLESRRSA